MAVVSLQVGPDVDEELNTLGAAFREGRAETKGRIELRQERRAR